MLGLTGDAEDGFDAKSQTDDLPTGLADPPAPMGLSRAVWLIAGVLLVVAVVFYMVVANSASNS